MPREVVRRTVRPSPRDSGHRALLVFPLIEGTASIRRGGSQGGNQACTTPRLIMLTIDRWRVGIRLGPPHPAITELRQWAQQARAGRPKTLRKRVRSLLLVVREARQCLREHGPTVREQHGVSAAKQAFELTLCFLRYGLTPISYYRFQLFRADRQPIAGQFVQHSDVGHAQLALIQSNPDDPGVFHDKRVFEVWCRTHGFPTVLPVAELANGRIVDETSLPLPRADLFSKPANWEGGNGAEAWTFDGDARWESSEGQVCTEPELIEYLAAQSHTLDRAILVQPRLTNHAAIQRLVQGGLSSARVMTTRTHGGDPTLAFAIFRMPVSASVPVDNFALGGIAAPIDVETGQLSPATRKYHPVSPPIRTHPATGVAIEGFVLPFWPEVRRLVVSAHDAVSWTADPVIGWDVAITNDGPVFLEGNRTPCSVIVQMPTGRPLTETPIVNAMNSHLRARFGQPANVFRLRKDLPRL